jgi:hypothetical protein
MRKDSAMRPALALLLLWPLSLKAQEIDKQKLLAMLRLPTVSLHPGYDFTGSDGKHQTRISGQDGCIRAEIRTRKKSLKHQPSD